MIQFPHMPTTPTTTSVELHKIFPRICDRTTSQDPDRWTADNPLWGHCAVVALAARNILGGKILRSSLLHIPAFTHMRSHYWNELPDGRQEDFTHPQFGAAYPENLQPEERSPSYILSFAPTRTRYHELMFRLARELHDRNPLFDDALYRECYMQAINSPCKKLKFGSIITRGEDIVTRTYNNTIEPLRDLCEPDCIRKHIQSRTESMIGACGHAEEIGIWEAVRKKIPLEECTLFVAGIDMNDMPWIKEKAVHTCLRCAVQQYHARLRAIYVPVIDRWMAIDPAEGVKQAKEFAMRRQTV
jgi:deoxycytidylate deaminase